MATMEKKEVCPRCFSESGQSIELKKEDDIYKCPNNPNHKFKRKGQFLEKVDEEELI